MRDLSRLRWLHDRYMRMTGPGATEPWDQPTYDSLVMGLIANADALLPPSGVVTNDWMATTSGRKFYPASPDYPGFDLDDLVWGISRACRYGGQIRPDVEHYSVAEHSVLMTRYFWDKVLGGLKVEHLAPHLLAELRTVAMHDLAEGLLSDHVRPIKREVPRLGSLEDGLSRLIAAKYGLVFPLPGWLKELDNRILVDEHRQVMPQSKQEWAVDGLEPLGVEVNFWSPLVAHTKYWELLSELHILG